MRWQYKVCLFLLLVSWTVFLVLAAYYIDNQAYHPGGKIESSLIFYSGIWYHFEHWSISLVLSFIAAVFGGFGLVVDIRKSGWKLSDIIRIEIIDDYESDLE